MKKILAIVLMMSLCFTLSACGNEGENGTETAQKNNKTPVAELKIGTPVEMDEQVIYDDKEIIIKAKKLEFDETSNDYCAYYYYEVTNNSKTDIFIEHLTFDVNGLSLHTPYKEEVVKSGETVENNIILNQNCCEWNDIKVIKELSFDLKIQTCHQKSANYENPDDPYGLDNYEIDGVLAEKTGDLVAKTKYADKYANYEQKINTNGTVLFEDENMTLVFNDIFTEDFSEDEKNLLAYIYCKNDYDFPIEVKYTANKINGEEISNESNSFTFPFKSEGFRFWWESKINYETIESMDFVYTVKNGITGEVILETETPVTLTFKK